MYGVDFLSSLFLKVYNPSWMNFCTVLRESCGVSFQGKICRFQKNSERNHVSVTSATSLTPAHPSTYGAVSEEHIDYIYTPGTNSFALSHFLDSLSLSLDFLFRYKISSKVFVSIFRRASSCTTDVVLYLWRETSNCWGDCPKRIFCAGGKSWSAEWVVAFG